MWSILILICLRGLGSPTPYRLSRPSTVRVHRWPTMFRPSRARLPMGSQVLASGARDLSRSYTPLVSKPRRLGSHAPEAVGAAPTVIPLQSGVGLPDT